MTIFKTVFVANNQLKYKHCEPKVKKPINITKAPNLMKALFIFFLLFSSVSVVHATSLIWKASSKISGNTTVSGKLALTFEENRVTGTISNLHASSILLSNDTFTLDFFSRQERVGSVRGYINAKGELKGHWVQFGMKLRSSSPYATPVHFIQTKENAYLGNISPLVDEQTIYIITQEKSEARYAATIFVPQTNAGRFYRDVELVLTDNKAKLVQTNRLLFSTLASGVYDAKRNSFYLNFPHWGGDIEFHLQNRDNSELVPQKRNVSYQVPSQQNDGWQVAHAKMHGLDVTSLTDFANQLRSSPASSPSDAQTEALLIARNGKLIFEQYFRGFDSFHPHDLRSASKSLTGIMPRLIEQAGMIENGTLLNSIIYQTLGVATKNQYKQKMKLKHALTMSTGLDCDDSNEDSLGNEDTMQSQTRELDWFA